MNAPLNVQVIQSLEGTPEYVLIPFAVYSALRKQIDGKLAGMKLGKGDYIPFELANYVDNPVALARIKTGLTQEELASRMSVTQAYISKLEAQDKVTPKMLAKVTDAISGLRKRAPTASSGARKARVPPKGKNAL